MRLVIFGPSGTGKGTQATKLVSRFDVPHLSTGNMLRAAIAGGSPIAEAVDSTIARGESVGDELMLALVSERQTQEDTRNGFVLDGFPRTGVQARGLDELLQAGGLRLDAVVELTVDKARMIERIERRFREALARGEKPRADDNAETARTRHRISSKHAIADSILPQSGTARLCGRHAADRQRPRRHHRSTSERACMIHQSSWNFTRDVLSAVQPNFMKSPRCIQEPRIN
ncbi:adenylate kinase family protein [Rhizobium leguminosarum]|uniref:adenylate kinase family protein n=1 Tax=Rhizobium leguminosarum TaxID=384 RepID=UPI003D15BB58